MKKERNVTLGADNSKKKNKDLALEGRWSAHEMSSEELRLLLSLKNAKWNHVMKIILIPQTYYFFS